jgi:hypothetical protein
MKESLDAVKVRFVRELAERTKKRVKYWAKREAWCRCRPGRKLMVGWEPFNGITSVREVVLSRDTPQLLHLTTTEIHSSSYVEIPD